jgi:pilus assembly protein Flp/PilA
MLQIRPGPLEGPTGVVFLTIKANSAMKVFTAKVCRFLRSENGPTAVEYATLLMLIFLVCLTGVTMFGQATATNLERSSEALRAVLEEPH